MRNILVQVSLYARSVAAQTYSATHDTFCHGWYEALEHAPAVVFHGQSHSDKKLTDTAE